ncbi:ArsR family transcriptional regulator [Streptomyces sp. NPDC050504]|uniref:ArsR/SmtB family transcription factor n=1 Tax=Streptomyces sp. NPDC050504 TaxID=3365618 RepID=UPI0037B864C4
MGEIRFGAEDLAQLRFAISPLWETVAALRATADPGRYALHLPWIKRALAVGEERVALLPRAGELAASVPAPRCPLAEIEEEAAVMGAGAAGVLAWWRVGVLPYWPRIRAVLEADLAHRTRQLAEDGIQEVLAGLHPSLRWGGGRLASDDLGGGEFGLGDGEFGLGGGGITLAPSAFAARCVVLPGREGVPPCLVYPARAVGTLWERGEACASGEGVARLLGRSRARVLSGTRTPSTTTGLALLTGLTPGAVSQHLGVLRGAGLVSGHRYRREVYYRASELGVALLEG